MASAYAVVDQGLQLRIERDALIEDETTAFVVRAADALEVTENATLELAHMLEPRRLHPERGLLATDTAGAEGHDRRALQGVAMRHERVGKIDEVVDR